MSKNSKCLGAILGFALLVVSCQKQESSTQSQSPGENAVSLRKSSLMKKPGTAMPSNMQVLFTGLNNPRGLEFGPDGNLYVAEGGTGGVNSTAGTCEQVIFPVGPYLGSPTGSGVSMITPSGMRTVITNNLPSSSANEIIGGDVEGVADVAFIGETLYALIAGAGCSHGVTSMPNGIVRRNSDGSWTMIADISSWLMAHPVARPEEEDFEPDGTPYSMEVVRGDFYVVEPNHGDFLKVTTDGTISRVVDMSASQGHIVPTALAYKGNFFIGNLHPFPIVDGSSNIYKVNPGGEVKVWATGLTTVLGLVIDKRDRMYVLENTVGSPSGFPTPGLGQVVRIDPSGNKTTIATGLSLPTGMTMGPDGNLYVSNWGFSPAAIGGGQVIKITL